MRSALIRRLALASILAASACAAPRVGPAHDVSPKVASRLAAAPATYAPDAAQVPAANESARLRANFESGLLPAAKGSLAHEPALDTVAAVIADMVSGEQQAPSQALVTWLFWRAGAVSELARVEAMTTTGVDDLDLQTADFAGKVQASVYPEAFGIARSSRGKPAQAIVFGRRMVAVDPFPKSYATGAPITLKVKPLDAFTELRLSADDEAGGVVEVKGQTAADGSFTVTHKAPAKPGRYFLEVSGLDARTTAAMPENPWRRSLLWVPIYVGVPEPAAPDDFIRAPAPNPADVTSWGARVLEGYNAARAKAGKKPLATDGRLTTLAQEKSGVVARAGRTPPPDGALADKLAATGNPPHDYDEVHARVDTISAFVGLRLLSPLARRRVVSPDLAFVGLGVSPNAANAKGEIDYTVVEYDIEPVTKLDPAKDKQRIVDALDEQQKAEGRAAFKHDEDVAKAVQGFADEVCQGAKRPNQMKPLVDKARGVGEKYKTWNTPVWRLGYDFPRWQEVSVLAKSKEPPLPYVEVGICQGNLPAKPGGSYVVVIAYGP
jgi:uncharacterized protein YkwD